MNDQYAFDPQYGAADGSIGMIGWVIMLAIWLYYGFCMYKMAQKSGDSENAWWGYIPILNTLLLIKMADKPMWWFVLLLVPIVNIVAFFVLWIETAKNVGSTALWGFLAMVPFINFIAISVMAFSAPPKRFPRQGAPPVSPTAPPPRETIGA